MEIQERELRKMRMSREEFEKLAPRAQEHIMRFVASDREREKKEKDERLQKEQVEAARQLQLGFCDVLALPSPGNIKAELTIDKNRIFVVDSFSGDSREHVRQVKTPEGEIVTQRTIVGRVKGDKQGRGVLKQKHENVMYGLFDLWAKTGKKLVEIGGRPQACILTSPHQLVEFICGRDNAAGYTQIRSILRDLASIPITIENAHTRHGINELEFTILGGLEWHIRHKKKKEHESPSPETQRKPGRVYILFSSVATESFMFGYVKDFSLETYRKLGGDKRQGPRKTIARALYRLLDTELASKTAYNISLTRLAADLGMRSYQHRSNRKQKFDDAVAAVNDQPVCGGAYHIKVDLRSSKNNDDYILLAQRAPAPEGLRKFLEAKLAHEPVCNVGLVDLLARLGIRPQEGKTARKEMLDPIMRVINGSSIRDGAYRIEVCLRLSSREDDYKLTARRVATTS